MYVISPPDVATGVTLGRYSVFTTCPSCHSQVKRYTKALLSLVEILHFCALIGRELHSDGIFSPGQHRGGQAQRLWGGTGGCSALLYWVTITITITITRTIIDNNKSQRKCLSYDKLFSNP